jgi:Leucine-rich repeat (LRR) protein
MSEGSKDLKKLIMKNPTGYARENDLDLFEMFDSIALNASNLPKLKKITVSQFFLAHSTLDTLAVATISLPSLQFLDISGNKLDSTVLNKFFKTIRGRHRLRHINIGYNTGGAVG